MKKIKLDGLLPIILAVATGIGTMIAALKDHQKTEKVDELIDEVKKLTQK